MNLSFRTLFREIFLKRAARISKELMNFPFFPNRYQHIIAKFPRLTIVYGLCQKNSLLGNFRYLPAHIYVQKLT